jgi:hypothetical protein
VDTTYEAARCAFARTGFPESMWPVFLEGWNGLVEYRVERKQQIEAGGGWRLLSVMGIAFGLMLSLGITFVWYMAPTGLIVSRAGFGIGLGVLLLAGGVYGSIKERDVARAAREKFVERWRE